IAGKPDPVTDRGVRVQLSGIQLAAQVGRPVGLRLVGGRRSDRQEAPTPTKLPSKSADVKRRRIANPLMPHIGQSTALPGWEARGTLVDPARESVRIRAGGRRTAPAPPGRSARTAPARRRSPAGSGPTLA